MLCSAFSTRFTISRSTVSGEAPGYGIVTTMTGCSTSGMLFTRSFFRAMSPRHMSAMMITTVATGRRMLKSERIMRAPGGSLGRRGRGDRGGLRPRGLHGLPILQERGRVAEHAVALREALGDGELARARVA